jgi:hypothetical protein
MGLEDVNLLLDLPDADMEMPSDSEFPARIPSPPPTTVFENDSDHTPPPIPRHRPASKYYDESDEEDDASDDSGKPHRQRRRINKGAKPGTSWAHQKELNVAARTSTFVPQSSRVGNFRAKVLNDDGNAEFDNEDVRRVRCSHCAEWVVMRALYDTRRWTDHRATAKCTKARCAGLSTRSLFSLGFAKASGRKVIPPPEMQPLPCPGLTRESNEKIGIYIARATASGGGAPSRIRIAKELLELEDVEWGDLSASEQRMVIRRELTLHKWKIGRSVGAVFASDCFRDVSAPIGGDPEPCSPCQKLLKLHTFQVAINRRMPDASKMKYVPKAHLDEVLGKLYLQFHGVRELIELVGDCLSQVRMFSDISIFLGRRSIPFPEVRRGLC